MSWPKSQQDRLLSSEPQEVNHLSRPHAKRARTIVEKRPEYKWFFLDPQVKGGIVPKIPWVWCAL